MMATANSMRDTVLRDISNAVRSVPQASRDDLDAQFGRILMDETPRPVVDGVLVDRFVQKHEAVHGTVSIVKTYAQVPVRVQAFLDLYELPPNIVMSSTDDLARLDWPAGWQIARRTAQKSDVVGVTGVMCAIAETGTLVVTSSPQVSSTHLYLPENHIAIFDAGQIVRHLEDALSFCSESVIRQSRGIHMITGPSKTADVEQTIQYGAHGPRRLHAIIVDGSA